MASKPNRWNHGFEQTRRDEQQQPFHQVLWYRTHLKGRAQYEHSDGGDAGSVGPAVFARAADREPYQQIVPLAVRQRHALHDAGFFMTGSYRTRTTCR